MRPFRKSLANTSAIPSGSPISASKRLSEGVATDYPDVTVYPQRRPIKLGTTTKETTQWLYDLAAHTPFNIAPERGPSLAADIFGEGRWELRPSTTAANFYAIPADRAIYLSYAGLASLWSLAYAAFHVADSASRKQRAASDSSRTQIDIGEESSKLKLKDYVHYSAELFKGDQNWPVQLSQPNANAPFDTPDGRVNNLFFGALSWIILHEIAHIHHKHVKYLPANLLVRQEYQADDFATRWILGQAGDGPEREFRVLMIAVAMTWLFLNERARGTGGDHPPAIHRFREAAQLFKVGELSAGLENAAYIFKALLDPSTPAPQFDTPEKMFDWVSERLEKLFPAY